MGSELALVRAFPGVAGLPRVPFVEVPTPVAPLRLPGVPEGALWVKRDDLSCPLYGGNKPRKLEFVIGAAAARRSRRLVTTGGLGTHHGLATAVLGRSQGMATTVVLVEQPHTEHVRDQLRALLESGAELVYGRNIAGAALQTARALARSTLRGERPTLVATGGSSALGDVGFVSAAFELADQIASGALAEPREIFLPVGSGGTLSGLVLGARLVGLRARITGVLVTDLLPPSPARLARLANATLALLRRADPTMPAVRVAPTDFAIVRGQLGAGYGAPTAAGRDAQERARRAGLELEDVYTAKCLAEILARLDAEPQAGPLLFWNTYSSIAPARALPEARTDSLPAPLRAILAEEAAA